jgi:carotenoid cleavage dioxygenase-like enzyme
MKSWKRLFNYPFREVNNEPLRILQGALPTNLKGTLFRNTSVFLPRINENLGHLFDGVLK